MGGYQRFLPLYLVCYIQPIGKTLTRVERINLVSYGLRAISVHIRDCDLGALFGQHER